ncbi:MAG TPA: TadE family protein, partial [Terriglobales bacterium]|nr:TadE family protein [Terriglobales bacterium]
MSSITPKRGQREEGQAMVEFALVITFVFLLFVSILQMILYMYAYNTLADAAKEGVRYAIVHGTGSGAGSCSGPGTATGVTPAVSCTSDPNGTYVVTAVIGRNRALCGPTCGNAGYSFQNIATTNNG